MKADIEWVERLENRIKRTVRITFVGHDRIKWQFKRSDEDFWDYDTSPTAEEWETLEMKIDALYHRRRSPYKHLELVRKLKNKAAKE